MQAALQHHYDQVSYFEMVIIAISTAVELSSENIIVNHFSSFLVQCEETTYEERLYPAGKWACITKGEPKYEQSISLGFMKLIRYICKENSV
ncbi:hypothetical protein E2320_018552, partial [Naja naja]